MGNVIRSSKSSSSILSPLSASRPSSYSSFSDTLPLLSHEEETDGWLDGESLRDRVCATGEFSIIPIGHVVLEQEISVKRISHDECEIHYIATTSDTAELGKLGQLNLQFAIYELPASLINNPSEGFGAGLRLSFPPGHNIFEFYGRSIKLSDIVDMLFWGRATPQLVDAYVAFLIDRIANQNMHEGHIPGNGSYHLDYKYFTCQETKFIPGTRFNQNSIIFAVHVLDEKKHAFIAVYHCSAMRVELFDASWSAASDDARKSLVSRTLELLSIHDATHWEIHSQTNCTQFHDVQRGPLLIYFVLNILNGNEDANFRPIDNFYEFVRGVATELLAMNQDGMKILAALCRKDVEYDM